MNWEVEGMTLHVDGREFEFPYGIDYHAHVGDVVVVLLGSINAGANSDATFALESEARNVLGFAGGGHEWTIEAPPDDGDDVEYEGYDRLFHVFDRLLCLNVNGTLYDVDPDTGSLLESWPSNKFPLPGDTVDLGGEVQQVHQDGDRVYVRCRSGETDLLAFDSTGTKLWESTGRRGLLYFEDGTLYERVSNHPRRRTWYRLDASTGDRVEEVDKPR